MIVRIETEVDLESGEYRLTFRNKSNPGVGMDLAEIKKAFIRVAKDFCAERSEETTPENPN